MRKMSVAIAFFLVFGLFATAAQAEGGYNAQLFWPSIFGGNFIAIEDAETLCPLGFGGGLYLNYANGPVEIRVDDDPEFGVLNQLFTADVLAAFGPFSFLSIGVDVPIHLLARGRSFENVEEGEDMSALATETTLGDIRAEMKLRLLRQQKHWLGMALAPYVTFPTGDPAQFLGEGRITGGGTLILEHDFNVFNLGLNGGYQYKGDEDLLGVNMGDAWKAGAGVSRDFGALSFSLEYWASFLDSGSVDRAQGNPMELMATLRFKFGENGPRLVGGAGPGLTSGVGCPAYRLVAGMDYYYCAPEPTTGRLIVLVVDENDESLMAKLVITGPEQWDGSTSKKGKWKSDVAPGLYEVTASKKGYLPATAGPTVYLGDTTEVTLKLIEKDTTLTVLVTDKFTGDKLKSKVVFDKGTDKEKTLAIPAGKITKGWAPGTFKMMVTAKGYETKLTKTTVVKHKDNLVHVKLRKKIEKIGKIYFDFDSDVIRTKSYPVLDNVVDQINNLGKFKKIIIEGHCSREGTDEYNMNLSQRRAMSVKMYLAKKGIDASKLDPMAYGESRPIASNDTEEGREKNRRVEFIIEE